MMSWRTLIGVAVALLVAWGVLVLFLVLARPKARSFRRPCGSCRTHFGCFGDSRRTERSRAPFAYASGFCSGTLQSLAGDGGRPRGALARGGLAGYSRLQPVVQRRAGTASTRALSRPRRAGSLGRLTEGSSASCD